MTRPNRADHHAMANQTLLPTADTVERYLAIRGDHPRLRPGVTGLCDRALLQRSTLAVGAATAAAGVYAGCTGCLLAAPPVS